MIKIPQPSKLFASNAILASLLLAISLGFGITLSANDFLAQDTTTTETASLFDGASGYTQLAAEGGGGGAPPQGSTSAGGTKPSPSPSPSSQSSGKGGAAPSGKDPAMGGGSSASSGGGGRPSENSGTGPRDSFGGGKNNTGGGRSNPSPSQTSGKGGAAPSGRDPAMGNGSQGNNSSPQNQAQQYAKDLANYGQGKAGTPESRLDKITKTVDSTVRALLGGLFGGSSKPPTAPAGEYKTLDSVVRGLAVPKNVSEFKMGINLSSADAELKKSQDVYKTGITGGYGMPGYNGGPTKNTNETVVHKNSPTSVSDLIKSASVDSPPNATTYYKGTTLSSADKAAMKEQYSKYGAGQQMARDALMKNTTEDLTADAAQKAGYTGKLDTKDLIVKQDAISDYAGYGGNPNAPKPAGLGGGKSPSTPQNAAAQKTSLDDPKSSNIPAPADVQKFLSKRGMPENAVINGQFGYHLSEAIADAERVTGVTQKDLINEAARTPETQAQYYSNYIGQEYTYKGTTYHPDPSKLGHLAAVPPGGLTMVGDKKGQIAPGSRHQFGAAADLNAGPVRDYIRAHADKYGLETLANGKDAPHVQLGTEQYFSADGKNGPSLDKSIGKTTGQQQVAEKNSTTQKPDTAKPETQAPVEKTWFASIVDLGKKAATAVTPSPSTIAKATFAVEHPILTKIYLGLGFGGGSPTTPTDTAVREGGSDATSYFPIAPRPITVKTEVPPTAVTAAPLPNMFVMLGVIFNPRNTLLSYSNTLDTSTADGSKFAREESFFETRDGEYAFILASTEDQSSGTYITDSLALEFKNTTVDILYIDDRADGVLDDVYVNGKAVDDTHYLQAAQNQYVAELVSARRYLLGFRK